MKNRESRSAATGSRALLVVLGVAGLACLPFGPFSGGRLGGDVHDDVVADWSFANEVEVIQLETNPTSPHSVNTWCLGRGEHLYVPTSMILGPEDPREREWVRNVEMDPVVRVRVDGVVHELQAARVRDPAEFEAAREGLEQKYELDPEERDPEREIWIFRLESR